MILEQVKRWFFRPPLSVPSRPPVEKLDDNETEEQKRVVRHGSVTVIDNRVHVTNPDEEGSFATITVPDDPRIRVTIDGQPIVGKVFVHQDLIIQVDLHRTLPSRNVSIRVSEDSMEVWARVEIEPGVEYRLKDSAQVRHAVLEIEAHQVFPEPIPMEEMVATIQSAGYRGQLDLAAVEQLSRATETMERVVLRGKPPIPGIPARYELVQLPKVHDPLHRRMRVSTVPLGTTVAVLRQEIPGVPGRDVFGNEIQLSEKSDLPVLGDGVVEVNGRVVAAREGRLVFTRSRIDVVPELVIGHDVTSKDGKIEFDGNIIIFGSILDGSYIHAAGSVEVHGSVLCSTVMGERGVVVANTIVGSSVVAGQSELLYGKLRSDLKQCLADFEQFEREYMEVVEHAKKRLDGHQRVRMVADLLLTKRHPHLETSFQHLCDAQDGMFKQNDRHNHLVAVLRSKWLGIGRTCIDERDVARLRQLLAEYLEHLESARSSGQADLRCASVTSSSLRSSGNIVVTGSGAYASTFESGDSIVVRGRVRGGFLVAERAVRVHELGTPSGTETSIKVLSQAGKIVIQTRHPNTLIEVHGHRDRSFTTEYGVVYRGQGHAHSDAARGRFS